MALRKSEGCLSKLGSVFVCCDVVVIVGEGVTAVVDGAVTVVVGEVVTAAVVEGVVDSVVSLLQLEEIRTIENRTAGKKDEHLVTFVSYSFQVLALDLSFIQK